MHGLPSPCTFTCVSFSRCPYSWQFLLGYLLNSRQKNQWKIKCCFVYCFPQSKQFTVNWFYHFRIVVRLCRYNRQISSGSVSFLYFVILCYMWSFRPFKAIWMEQRKSLRVYMLFLCQSFNNKGFHLQRRNTFKRMLLFASMICRWAGCITEQLG